MLTETRAKVDLGVLVPAAVARAFATACVAHCSLCRRRRHRAAVAPSEAAVVVPIFSENRGCSEAARGACCDARVPPLAVGVEN